MACVGYNEIAAQGFNISVDRYVRTDAEVAVEQLIGKGESVELGDIAEIMRPQSFAGDASSEGRSFAEVALGDIEVDGSIKTPAKRVTVDERSVGKSLGTDLSERKMTLPLLRLLERVPADSAAAVRRMLVDGAVGDPRAALRAIVDFAPDVESAQETAHDFVRQARDRAYHAMSTLAGTGRMTSGGASPDAGKSRRHWHTV